MLLKKPTIKISIHALREEGDLVLVGVCVNRCKISIHALREEGDNQKGGQNHAGQISIHALREEGDVLCFHNRFCTHEFLSTPSARRATKYACTPVRLPWISIHALREEGDRRVAASSKLTAVFLSTPSARRATDAVV